MNFLLESGVDPRRLIGSPIFAESFHYNQGNPTPWMKLREIGWKLSDFQNIFFQCHDREASLLNFCKVASPKFLEAFMDDLPLTRFENLNLSELAGDKDSCGIC